MRNLSDIEIFGEVQKLSGRPADHVVRPKIDCVEIGADWGFSKAWPEV